MMRSELEALLSQPPALLNHAADEGVILGALGSLELNLEGFPFPGWSSEESRRAVAEPLLRALHALSGRDWALSSEVAELSQQERLLLMERGQLTPTLAARQSGVHLLLNRTQDTECFINDEEHLHLQTFYPAAGASCREQAQRAIEEMLRLRAELEKNLTVAKDPIFGYLSFDPSKAGAGIFLSYLVYLPGLRLCKHMQQVQHALDEMGIFLSPLFSLQKKEGGDLWLVHSPAAPAQQLEATMEDMVQAMEDLALQESHARARLLHGGKQTDRLRNSVADAYETLLQSVRLRYSRMLESLSLVRLGLHYGWLEMKAEAAQAAPLLSRAYLETAPLTLAPRAETPLARRKARAAYMHELMTDKLGVYPIFTLTRHE